MHTFLFSYRHATLYLNIAALIAQRCALYEVITGNTWGYMAESTTSKAIKDGHSSRK